MWIPICLTRWTNINAKNVRKRSFSYKTKASTSFILIRRMRLWCPIIKTKEIVMQIRVCPNRWININSENGRKRSFFYETKASISFIPMRRMCLMRQILKRKEIIMWICDSPNRRTNINCKNGRKRSFLSEAKVSISFILIRKMCLWCPIMKRKGIMIWIHVYPNF